MDRSCSTRSLPGGDARAGQQGGAVVSRGLPDRALDGLCPPSAVVVTEERAEPATGVAGPARVRAPLPLFEAIDRLPVAVEHREGYKRDLYKHWNLGLNAGDGCDTRKEVILAEAVEAPQVAAGCKLTGGSWRSACDDIVVTDTARLDVDHFVPSPRCSTLSRCRGRRAGGRRTRTPGLPGHADRGLRRLQPVEGRQGPAEWLPSDGSYHCTYAATWVGTKLRWDLAVDENERQALLGLAEDCPTAL
ncbi:hypothetical protein EES41_39430 (plasmid) [Streptomyces sp. ADI95-16]|nr:hypothetical protein EES41_39430 [Streptomyces sp. ADI95-16]